MTAAATQSTASARSVDGRYFTAYGDTREEAEAKLTIMIGNTELAPGFPAGYDADADCWWWTGGPQATTYQEPVIPAPMFPVRTFDPQTAPFTARCVSQWGIEYVGEGDTAEEANERLREALEKGHEEYSLSFQAVLDAKAKATR